MCADEAYKYFQPDEWFIRCSKEIVMAAKVKKISVAAAEAMYRQVKMKRDRQVQALADTELQLAGCEELLSAAREQDKQVDLVPAK